MGDQTAGRFNVSLLLISDETPMTEEIDPSQSYGQTAADAIRNKQPLADGFKAKSVTYVPFEDTNYEWRVRIDVRSGIDMPFNSHKPHRLPSMQVEVAWSESIYYETVNPFTRLYTLAIEDNRHPNWN
jgi:hypothetical protein